LGFEHCRRWETHKDNCRDSEAHDGLSLLLGLCIDAEERLFVLQIEKLLDLNGEAKLVTSHHDTQDEYQD